MKKSFLLAVLTLFIALSFAQSVPYFEGVVLYEHEYESKDPSVDTARMAKAYGRKSEFYFKDGHFRQAYDGKYLQSNLYNIKENRLYTQTYATDTIYWIDASKPTEKKAKVEHLPTDVKILGFSCKKMILTAKDLKGKGGRTTEYYYTPFVSLDPAWYINAKSSSMDMIYGEMKSIPLKIIFETDTYKITMTAQEVRFKQMDLELFDVGNGLPNTPAPKQ